MPAFHAHFYRNKYEQFLSERNPQSARQYQLDVHTGNAQKKMELPLKLLVTGDFSNGQEQRVAVRARKN